MKIAYQILLLLLVTAAVSQVIDIGSSGGVPVDVYFLADNTGSMSKEIKDVKDQAKFIFNQLAAEIGSANIKFGVGAYKDFGDNFVFKNLLSLTQENLDVPADQDAIVLAMGDWESSGGGADLAEAQLYALYQIASVEYQTIGWRQDAVKVIVWFGDAPGHDPVSRTVDRIPITEELVTDALVQADIRVSAIDVENMDETGQASRIAAATNGDFTVNTRQQGEPQTITPAPAPQTPAPSQNQSTPVRVPNSNPAPTPGAVPKTVKNEVPATENMADEESPNQGNISTDLLQFSSSPEDPFAVNLDSPVDYDILNSGPEDPIIVNQESVVFYESTLIPQQSEEVDLASAIVGSVTNVVNLAVNS